MTRDANFTGRLQFNLTLARIYLGQGRPDLLIYLARALGIGGAA